MNQIESLPFDTNVVHELQKLADDVDEYIEKGEIDPKKLYELRFQQLMRGIYLTQNSPF